MAAGHDVILRKASSPPTSMARCMHYSTWSTVHSYFLMIQGHWKPVTWVV